MVKVSVVIPIYNVEKYLEQCLDSVINQTLDDIEIICINDGSEDNSLDILNKYALNDNRFKIINQKNKGLGATRNIGINLAKGKYIFFIDSDDYIKYNALMELYNICENKNLDFALCKVKNYDEKNDKLFNSEYYDLPLLESTVKNNVFNYNDINSIISKINVVAWNKLYNLNFLRKINARFSENLIFEDNIFFWKVLFNAKRIYFYQKYLYIYRIRDSSITSSGNKNLMDTIEIHNQIFNIFKEYDLFETHKEFLFNKKVSLIYTRLEQIHENYKEIFFKKIKEDFIKMVEKYSINYLLKFLDDKTSVILNNIITSNNYVELKLKNKIFYKSIEIEKLKEEYMILNKKNNKLKKKIETTNNKNKEIYSSISWKITKPLRKFRTINIKIFTLKNE